MTSREPSTTTVNPHNAMYGLVNKAIEDLVRSRFGGETWEKIKAEAGIDIDVFLSNQSYPDETTYRLVGAATKVLGVEASVVLELFGEHWVLKTAQGGYGDMMATHGRTFPEFLANLPNFHARVSLVFPKLQPPEFNISDQTDDSLRLHYYSHRPGLAPFVVGLIRGLGTMFHVTASATLEQGRESGLDHDIFLVRWSANAAS